MQPISGKLVASGLAAIQETTFALANINFDFALYKVEPPTEYKELGLSLSKNHRDAAEHGTEHIFARKLAALFSQIIPATPNLIKAYGLRASEIAKASAKSTSSSSRSYGIFKDCTGPDATSIWAAATSGPGAIAVHLLACMLARAWPSDKAEAIWDEIIQARKDELLNMDQSEHIFPATELAARIDIDRDQISRWNASAKAWLEVADSAKKRQQTQLELLTGNTSLAISGSAGTYQSVITAWKLALQTVDNLVAGEPQSIQDGAVILGLKSWHLFPDIFALSAGQNKIQLRDPLLPQSAIITLGVSSCSPDSEGSVFWSLPLSYVRYYGDPVPSLANVVESTTRLLLQEFFQVILGSVFSSWAEHGRDIQTASEFVFHLGEFITSSKSTLAKKPRSWVELLAEAAESYLSAEGSDKEYIQSLILRGRRRYKNFLADPDEHRPPFFGITRVTTLLSLIVDNEKRVSALRLIAKRLLKARPDALLIRYARKLPESPRIETHFAAAFEDTEPNVWDGFTPPEGCDWEYATALKSGHNIRKRKVEPSFDLAGYIRWRNPATLNDKLRPNEEPFAKLHTAGERYESLDGIDVLPCSPNSFKWCATVSHTTSTRQSKEPVDIYECILGDPKEAAIFRRVGVDVQGSDAVDVNLLLIALKSRWIDYSRLVRHLEDIGETISRVKGPAAIPHFTRNLRALAAAADAYKLMPDATIAASMFSKPLRDAFWFPNTGQSSTHKRNINDPELSLPFTSPLPIGTIDPRVLSQKPKRKEDEVTRQRKADLFTDLISYRLNRAQTFACIAMFENRNVNLDPSALNQVMALSTGNSIYVAMPLICDPFDSPSGHEIKRIVGNISKPGINLMIPPIQPKVKITAEDVWTQVNHNDFDGKLEDCFQYTSMHLSFTRYKLPASVASHGDQAVDATFIETLVSVFDHQKWIADLDVLKAVEERLLRFDTLPRCRHKVPLTKPRFPLISIDTWEEFLDRPSAPSVFRANKNWLARLAGAVLNAQRGFKTIVLDDKAHICWACVTDRSLNWGKDTISLSETDNREECIPTFIC
jgi:hypothetical protein